MKNIDKLKGKRSWWVRNSSLIWPFAILGGVGVYLTYRKANELSKDNVLTDEKFKNNYKMIFGTSESNSYQNRRLGAKKIQWSKKQQD